MNSLKFTQISHRIVAVLGVGVMLAACGGGGGGDTAARTGLLNDQIPPIVSSINPIDKATGIAVDSIVTATFSETIQKSAILNNFTLYHGASSVAGTVDYSGTTATFTPSGNLAYATEYTASLTNSIQDLAGNALAETTWKFTTGPAPDTTPPTVVTPASPASGATGVSLSALITATFSEPMNASSVNATNFTLSGASSVAGTVTYSDTTATFIPSVNLAGSTEYTATLTSGVKDLAGNALATAYTWKFTTGTAPDTTPPTVVTPTSPATGATGVPVKALITATFSEAVQAATVLSNFTLSNGASSVAGTVTYSGTTATFKPSNDLDYATVYTATLTTGIKDLANNAMGSNHAWAFTTRTQPLNDTGITNSQCYQAASSVLGTCGGTAQIALSPTQDGMVGRDVTTSTSLPYDGKLGFSFTAINNGACMQDNVTGLMWESKNAVAGDLHNGSNTYTNYDNTAAAQVNGVNPTQAQIDAPTNSIGFVKAVNTATLCGFNDWRLPTAHELQSIVDYGVATPGPTIDATWFPNTQASYYWSTSPYVGYPAHAWSVYFFTGSVNGYLRANSYYVRLVRAGQ